MEKKQETNEYILYINYDSLGDKHEIYEYKQPQKRQINGKNIIFDKIEIESFYGALGGLLETYCFYYYKGELIANE